jgi:hypothetical protein
MRHCTISCDRCSSPISGGHSILEVKAGELSKTRDDQIDLCSSCCAEFVDWLRGTSKFELWASDATATA